MSARMRTTLLFGVLLWGSVLLLVKGGEDIDEEDGAVTIESAGEDSSGDTTILQSPLVTNWGRWGRFAHCSMTNSFVTGFQVKLEAKEDQSDNTAVNGITLSCGIPEQKEIERVTSAEGPWGKAQKRMFCATGPAVGFQLKVQKPQGRDIDDVATINVRMICRNGQILEGYDEKGNYYVDTQWTDEVVCPTNMAVCGMQTQVEPRRWLGDDTALNNIRIQCCTLSDSPPDEGHNSSIFVSTTGAPQKAPYNLTVYQSQDGTGQGDTLEMVEEYCHNLPNRWHKQVGSFYKSTTCLRLWSGTDCSGLSRCYCDDNFLSLNDSYSMTDEVSWYKQMAAVGPCWRGDNKLKKRHAEVLLYSEMGFQGERTALVLAPKECLTFGDKDRWRGKTKSLIVSRGCVKLYDGGDCTWDEITVESSMDYVGSKWEKRVKSIKNCNNK